MESSIEDRDVVLGAGLPPIPERLLLAHAQGECSSSVAPAFRSQQVCRTSVNWSSVFMNDSMQQFMKSSPVCRVTPATNGKPTAQVLPITKRPK